MTMMMSATPHRPAGRRISRTRRVRRVQLRFLCQNRSDCQCHVVLRLVRTRCVIGSNHRHECRLSCSSRASSSSAFSRRRPYGSHHGVSGDRRIFARFRRWRNATAGSSSTATVFSITPIGADARWLNLIPSKTSCLFANSSRELCFDVCFRARERGDREEALGLTREIARIDRELAELQDEYDVLSASNAASLCPTAAPPVKHL